MNLRKKPNPTALVHPARVPAGAGMAILALVFLLLFAGRAAAATQVWDGGCGADHSWSCAVNWKSNVAPGPGDTATFNAKSVGTSVVDPGFGGEVATVSLAAGFSGTVVLDRSLTVSKNFQQVSGHFAAGAHALAAQTFLLSGGSFEASSATTSVTASMKISGTPEFDANGGAVVFKGTGGTLTCGGATLNRVVFENTAGTKTVTPSCDLPLGNDPVAGAGGSIKLEGALSGSGTLNATGTLVLGPAGSLSGFSGLDANNLTVSGAYDFGGYSGLSVNQTFTVSASGDFIAPAAIASFAGRFRVVAGSSFDANGGEIVFDGTSNSSVACGNKPLALVSFEQTSGIKSVESDCSLPLGPNPSLGDGSEAGVKLSGTLSGTGTLAADGNLTLNRTAQLTGFGGLDVDGNLTATSATADFGSYAPFTVDGAYSQAAGKVTLPSGADVGGAFALNPRAVFEAPAGSVSVGGDFSVNPEATFHANGGTIVFDGSQSATLTCGSAKFGSIAFSHVAGTKTVSPSCSLPLGGSPSAGTGSVALEGTLSGSGTLSTGGTLTLREGSSLSGFSGLAAQGLAVEGSSDFDGYSSFSVGKGFAVGATGSFKAPKGAASFAGDFANNGTFLANGGTVVLNGSGQTVSGNTTFNNLTKVAASAETLSFATGQTQSVQGLLKLKGKGAGSLLKLAPTASGSPWKLNRAGAAEVEFVSVAESTNVGTSIVAPESFSEGGNSGWSISGQAVQLVLEAQSTTPTAGATDNLTIVAKDAYGNTSASYAGSHNLTFSPAADSPSGAHATVTSSSGTAVNFGTATPIGFNEGLATVSGAKNGAMTLVKTGSTSVTVSDGSISNGSGLAVSVSPGAAASLTLEAQTTTPIAGETDNLTITAKDSLGNVSSSYTGTHSLTFGPSADSPSGAHATVASFAGGGNQLGTPTNISFTNGVAAASGGKNGAMTLVKAGSTSVTVTDGSISNGSGLPITVSIGAPARIAWTHATVSKGTLSSPCFFTCTGAELSSTGTFKANVSVTDGSGNTVSGLGSGHTVSVTSASGTITGGTLTIAASGAAESTTQFTYASSKGGAVTLTAATASGTVYTSATASMSR
ncbi:MAG TPA: hypothetical protein VF245_00065 [Solirubrobacterales bacterium]